MVIRNKKLMKIYWYGNKLRLWDALPDELFIKAKYYLLLGKRLNLKKPESFNEKLQWLKLNDRNPIYPIIVDKVQVKGYIEKLVGSKYIIPTIGSWDSFDQIDFDELPEQFVLKCTHDSGGVVVCEDKATFDREAAKKKIEKSLKHNYYYVGREWPYKNVKPRIMAEPLMHDDVMGELVDYKIQCFNGKPDNVLVCYDRKSGNTKYRYFSTDWKFLRYCVWDEKTPKDFSFPQPEALDEMLQLARILSKGFPELRVDLYYINKKVYFGELTLYSNSGMDADLTDEADLELGRKLQLDINK